MVSPDGPGLAWPGFLDAQVTSGVGATLHFPLYRERRVVVTISLATRELPFIFHGVAMDSTCKTFSVFTF